MGPRCFAALPAVEGCLEALCWRLLPGREDDRAHWRSLEAQRTPLAFVIAGLASGLPALRPRGLSGGCGLTPFWCFCLLREAPVPRRGCWCVLAFVGRRGYGRPHQGGLVVCIALAWPRGLCQSRGRARARRCCLLGRLCLRWRRGDRARRCVDGRGKRWGSWRCQRRLRGWLRLPRILFLGACDRRVCGCRGAGCAWFRRGGDGCLGALLCLRCLGLRGARLKRGGSRRVDVGHSLGDRARGGAHEGVSCLCFCWNDGRRCWGLGCGCTSLGGRRRRRRRSEVLTLVCTVVRGPFGAEGRWSSDPGTIQRECPGRAAASPDRWLGVGRAHFLGHPAFDLDVHQRRELPMRFFQPVRGRRMVELLARVRVEPPGGRPASSVDVRGLADSAHVLGPRLSRDGVAAHCVEQILPWQPRGARSQGVLGPGCLDTWACPVGVVVHVPAIFWPRGGGDNLGEEGLHHRARAVVALQRREERVHC